MLASNPGPLVVSLVTPFAADGSLDHDRLAALADWIVSTGRADSLIVGDNVGEYLSLSEEERMASWRTVKEAVSDRAMVIAGTSGSSTRECVRYTRAAELVGADMVIAHCPDWMHPTQEGIEKYFTDMAEATELPVMLSVTSMNPGADVSTDTLRRLLDIDNVAVVSYNPRRTPVMGSEHLAALATRENVQFYVNSNTLALPMLIQGAHGIVSGSCQIAGQQMRQMVEALGECRNDQAAALHLSMLPVFAALAGHGHRCRVPGLRRALELLGQPVGPPREPLLPFSNIETAHLRESLVLAGLLAQ